MVMIEGEKFVNFRDLSKDRFEYLDLAFMRKAKELLDGMNVVELRLAKGTMVSIVFLRNKVTGIVTLEIPYHAGLKEIILKKMEKMRDNNYCYFNFVYR